MRAISIIAAVLCAVFTNAGAVAAAYVFDANAGDRTVKLIVEGRTEPLTGRDYAALRRGKVSALFTFGLQDGAYSYVLAGPSTGKAFLDWRRGRLVFVTTEALRQRGFEKTVTLSFATRHHGPMKSARDVFAALARGDLEFEGLVRPPATAIPLPGALPLFLAGAGLGAAALRRGRKTP